MKYLEVLHQNLHMQGFVSDGEHFYWSFTDSLVKTNRRGTVIAQIPVCGGHLGDITYYNNCIYGSVMGNALKGNRWDDWTSFEIKVYDSRSLACINVIRLDECYRMFAEKEDGFVGIDGITMKPKDDGEGVNMLVACALADGVEYDRQIMLEYTLDGTLVKKHYVKTGNTRFGIQNLDRDPKTGHYWFTTYGAAQSYQNPNFLMHASENFELIEEFLFCTPYGFQALGDGRYYVSLQGGENGNRQGYAYEVYESFFKEQTISGDEHRPHVIMPWFDEKIGL